MIASRNTDSPLLLEKLNSETSTSKILATGEDKGKIRVFVYGSLKSQHGNNVLLQEVEATCLGYDSITGDFTMISFGGFPGIVRTTTDPKSVKTIFGELWMTNEEGLKALDMLEGHPNFYERFRYRTDVLDRRAWMYTLPPNEDRKSTRLNSSHTDISRMPSSA